MFFCGRQNGEVHGTWDFWHFRVKMVGKNKELGYLGTHFMYMRVQTTDLIVIS